MGRNLLKKQSNGIKNAFMILRLYNTCFLFLLMNIADIVSRKIPESSHIVYKDGLVSYTCVMSKQSTLCPVYFSQFVPSLK